MKVFNNSLMPYIQEVYIDSLEVGNYLIRNNWELCRIESFMTQSNMEDSRKSSDVLNGRSYICFEGFNVLKRSLGFMFMLSAFNPKKIKIIKEEFIKK